LLLIFRHQVYTAGHTQESRWGTMDIGLE